MFGDLAMREHEDKLVIDLEETGYLFPTKPTVESILAEVKSEKEDGANSLMSLFLKKVRFSSNRYAARSPIISSASATSPLKLDQIGQTRQVSCFIPKEIGLS